MVMKTFIILFSIYAWGMINRICPLALILFTFLSVVVRAGEHPESMNVFPHDLPSLQKGPNKSDPAVPTTGWRNMGFRPALPMGPNVVTQVATPTDQVIAKSDVPYLQLDLYSRYVHLPDLCISSPKNWLTPKTNPRANPRASPLIHPLITP